MIIHDFLNSKIVILRSSYVKKLDLKAKTLILMAIYIAIIIMITIKHGKFPLKTPSVMMPFILFGLNSVISKKYNFIIVVMGLLIIDGIILIAYLFS